MQNRDNQFLQRLKENAFSLALGIGLLAIVAVVAVYTKNQQQLASGDIDTSHTSDYEILLTEEPRETNGNISKQKGEQHLQDTTKAPIASKAEVTNTDVTILEESQDLQEPVAKQDADEYVEDCTDGQSKEAMSFTEGLNFASDKSIGWPIEGSVVLPYSMETTVYFQTLDQYQVNPGMLIGAEVGSIVKNAYLGQVVSVTSDDMYGNMVTLNLGNGYRVVYGQLDTVYVSEGDVIETGASIGTIAAPTRCFSEEGPHLFFQMYDGENAIDPLLYME